MADLWNEIGQRAVNYKFAMPKKENETPKRPRLIDVAREANLSVQAVSHVLSGNESARIPEATRARIREAAARVGYAPNRLAQAMKTGRTKVIALWLPLDRPTTTYFNLLGRISRHARDVGYSLMIIGVDRDLAYRGVGKAPEFWPVDGVIAIDAGKALQTFRDDPRNDRTPAVVLAFEEFKNADTVGWDVYGGARQAVEHAIQAGRTNVIHVSPKWIVDDYPREQRRRGYTDAMVAAGLEPVIVPCEYESSDSAELAVEAYLQNHPLPQAVFGFLDNLAMGAARAVLEAGGRIPEDCWVIGVGDTPEAAQFRVPLSSLKIPIEGLVDRAWTWLLDRIADTEQESRVVVLPMEFVERRSTQS